MKGYKHLMQEQKQAILATYERTKSSRVAADEVGASLQQVQHLLKLHGIPLYNVRSKKFVEHAEEIQQWAKEGLSLSEIGRRIGCDHHKVKSFLERTQMERTPFVQVGSNNPAWKGGRQVDKHGYILVYQPDHPSANRHGYVREHRIVMEQVLGRFLLPTEVVHHIDNDPANNHPDNLEVFGSNGEHLAETLKGQVPQWSDQGKERISEAVSQAHKRRDKSSYYRLVTNGSESRYIFAPRQVLDDKGQLRPS